MGVTPTARSELGLRLMLAEGDREMPPVERLMLGPADRLMLGDGVREIPAVERLMLGLVRLSVSLDRGDVILRLFGTLAPDGLREMLGLPRSDVDGDRLIDGEEPERDVSGRVTPPEGEREIDGERAESEGVRLMPDEGLRWIDPERFELLGERLIDGPDERLVSLPLGRRTSGVELPLREALGDWEIDGELNRDAPEPGRTIWPSDRPMDGELVVERLGASRKLWMLLLGGVYVRCWELDGR